MALLLDFGADVNFADEEGWTALHHAVDFSIDSSIQAGLSPGDESVDSIDWLVQHGANLDARTNEDETLLDFARSYRSDRVEQVLLKVQT